MQRRAVLKSLAIVGLGIVIPFRKSGAQPINPFKRPFHQFTLGKLSLTVITDGYIRLSPVQPNFPNGSVAAENDLLEQHFRSTKELDLGMNILLVKKDKEVVLIDTGTGGSFGPASGWMLSSMADAGFKPTDITQVIISHAHPDHIGGLLTKEQQPVFPNAQVHLSRIEHGFWMAATQDFSRSKFQDKALMKVFTTNTQQTIRTLGERIHLFEDGAVFLDCIKMEITPGHTPGHAITHIYSGGEKMVHLADLIHSDIISLPHPEWGFNGDTDMELAATTRKKVLSTLTKNKTYVFAYHFPWPGLGHVRAKDTAFEWIPDVFAVPG